MEHIWDERNIENLNKIIEFKAVITFVNMWWDWWHAWLMRWICDEKDKLAISLQDSWKEDSFLANLLSVKVWICDENDNLMVKWNLRREDRAEKKYFWAIVWNRLKKFVCEYVMGEIICWWNGSHIKRKGPHQVFTGFYPKAARQPWTFAQSTKPEAFLLSNLPFVKCK